MIGPLPHSGPVKTIMDNTGYNDYLSEIETLSEKICKNRSQERWRFTKKIRLKKEILISMEKLK